MTNLHKTSIEWEARRAMIRAYARPDIALWDNFKQGQGGGLMGSLEGSSIMRTCPPSNDS
jgi:hypothetical protein